MNQGKEIRKTKYIWNKKEKHAMKNIILPPTLLGF